MKSLAYLHKYVPFSCPGDQNGGIGVRLSFSCSTCFRLIRAALEIAPTAIAPERSAVIWSVTRFDASGYLLVDRDNDVIGRTVGSKSKVAGVAGMRRERGAEDV